MHIIPEQRLNSLREQFPRDTRVELIKMDDVQAPPVGKKGTVQGVDDAGNIMVCWDNGSSLSVVYGVDKIRKDTGDKYENHMQ